MTTLLPHQVDGAMWLYGKERAYLADEPGLGKTRTVLASIPKSNTIGVVCPAIVIPHWTNEAVALDRDPTKVYAVSFQSLISSKGPARRTLLADCDTIIIDEAHLCSNPEAKRTQAVFGAQGIATKAPHTICASGTPMARHPGNLYSTIFSQAPHILRFLHVKTFMDWIDLTCEYEFRKVPGAGPFTKPQLHVSAAKDSAMLHRLLTEPIGSYAPYMLRRTEQDAGLSLPSLWWQWKALAINTTAFDAAYQSLPDDIRERLARLPTQMGNSPGATVIRHALGVAKAEAILPTLCDELSSGAGPCVVVAHHGAVCDLLAHGFSRAGLTYVRVDGSTSQPDRIEAMRRFQAGEVTVFLGSIGAMQTGVTLTRAHRIVIVEPGWTGDSNMQVVKRIHRISQQHACRAELLFAAGTLEEAVMRQVEAEIAMAESVIDGATRAIRASHEE
jgi:hypothetical protein